MNIETRKRYKNKTQCRSCQFDCPWGCDLLLNWDCKSDEVEEWQCEQEWRHGQPRVDAEGCPGWQIRSELL